MEFGLIAATAADWPIVGQIAWVFGKLMDAIYNFLNLFGIQNIGICIILFTIIIYTLMIPLTIKQQKFSKMQSVMMPEIQKLQKKYALSEQGAKDLIKGCLACVLQNLSFMFPVGLLYYLVSDLMNGGVPGGKIPFYVAGCVVCIGLILLTTFFQYNATYFATYKESGIRRITLAEHLRKIPLSFFGKKDLADLTSTITVSYTHLTLPTKLEV